MGKRKFRYEISLELADWVEGDDPEQILEEIIGQFCIRAKSAPWLRSVIEVSISQRDRGYVASHTGGRLAASS